MPRMEEVNSEGYVDLAYEVFDGTDDDMMVPTLSPVIIFHGLLDNKENWLDIARSIADKSVRKVYVLDMRNHGDSPKTVNMTHEGNVNDLEIFLKKINEPVIFVGHSFGGTAATDIAFKKPHLVKGLVSIDISPLRYPENIVESRLIYSISELRSVINQINSKEGINKLNNTIDCYLHKNIKVKMGKKYVYLSAIRRAQNDSLRKLISSNLVENFQGFTAKANLVCIETDICQRKKIRGVYPLRGCYQGPTLLIHGELSEYILPSDYEKLKIVFPNSSITCVDNCGHWIHMEKPDDLIKIILQFLSKCD